MGETSLALQAYPRLKRDARQNRFQLLDISSYLKIMIGVPNFSDNPCSKSPLIQNEVFQAFWSQSFMLELPGKKLLNLDWCLRM